MKQHEASPQDAFADLDAYALGNLGIPVLLLLLLRGCFLLPPSQLLIWARLVQPLSFYRFDQPLCCCAFCWRFTAVLPLSSCASPGTAALFLQLRSLLLLS
jgi:hypothetical protein